MKLRNLVLAPVILSLLLIAGYAPAEIEGRGFTAEMGANVGSSYVWRGIVLSDDLVLQPSVGVKIDKPRISTELWTNLDLSGDNSGELTQTKFTADYNFTLADFGFDVGGIYYSYPTDSSYSAFVPPLDDTFELFGRIMWLEGIGVKPFVDFYLDIDKADGVYGDIGFQCDFPPYSDIKYGWQAKVGYANADYNKFYFNVDDASFADFDIRGYMSWAMKEHIFAAPYVGYSTLIDGELADMVSKDSAAYIGIGLTIEF